MRYLIIMLMLISGSAWSQEGFKGEHFIEVTGSAETEIEPNEITLAIRLKEFEENRAKTNLEKIDKDFLAALKDAGIEKKRLTLADAGSKLSRLGRKDKDAFREKTYQLVLNSASELEKLLEKIEPVKVDLVMITRLYHTDYEKIRLDLKIKALQAARTKAEALLKAINAEIGQPLMVREWEMDPQPLDMASNVAVRKSYADSDMEVEEPTTSFKKIRMRAQVSAQFQIK